MAANAADETVRRMASERSMRGLIITINVVELIVTGFCANIMVHRRISGIK